MSHGTFLKFLTLKILSCPPTISKFYKLIDMFASFFCWGGGGGGGLWFIVRVRVGVRVELRVRVEVRVRVRV